MHKPFLRSPELNSAQRSGGDSTLHLFSSKTTGQTRIQINRNKWATSNAQCAKKFISISIGNPTALHQRRASPQTFPGIFYFNLRHLNNPIIITTRWTELLSVNL